MITLAAPPHCAVQELADQALRLAARLPVDKRYLWGNGMTVCHEIATDDKHIGVIEIPYLKGQPWFQPEMAEALEGRVPLMDMDRSHCVWIGVWHLPEMSDEPTSDAEDRGTLQLTL